jgi:hypothetical protein
MCTTPGPVHNRWQRRSSLLRVLRRRFCTAIDDSARQARTAQLSERIAQEYDAPRLPSGSSAPWPSIPRLALVRAASPTGAQHAGSWTSSPSASRPRPNCWPAPPLTCWHSRHCPRRLAPDQVQQSQERQDSELAERVYRLKVCSCSRITSGLSRAASRFGPVSQPVRISIAPQPGTQEIASLNYLSVLVLVHFIKLAFTIGIESSFQILEIRSQWLHSLSSSSNRCLSIGHNNCHIWTGSRSDQRAVWQSDRNPVVGGRGKGDHIAALCRWPGLALPGDALTAAPGVGLRRAHGVTSPALPTRRPRHYRPWDPRTARRGPWPGAHYWP